jgi:glycosyltransferase involved in cell wall biosynthesis
MLGAFVSGFSRFAPGAAMPEIGDALVRADHVQNFYLAALKSGMPAAAKAELAFLTKLWLDRCCRRPLEKAGVFLHYSGCGLDAARSFRARGGISIVEAVNSHVLDQQGILREEYRRIGLPWRPFHTRETRRRVSEYDEADYVLVPSEFVRRTFLGRGFVPEKILKVPYRPRAIEGCSASVAPSRRDDGVFRILYVGSVSVRKGVRYLVEAFGRFRHPRKELLIVGPVSSSSGLENLALPHGVRFAGVLKGEKLRNAYRSATLFCLPTLEEGLALVMAEALGNGIPVVATDHSGAEDLFVDGREGVITRIRDVDALTGIFEKGAQDSFWLERLTENARLRARELAGLTSAPTLLVPTLRSLERPGCMRHDPSP